MQYTRSRHRRRTASRLQRGIRQPVITFDAGQTIIDLDLAFLATRLAERDVDIGVEALTAAAPAAWERYDERVAAGLGHPWREFMQALLAGAGVPRPEPLVEWLFHEQLRKNLWRRPIPEMMALVRELAGRGAQLAVLSNSEGALAELLGEIDVAAPFRAIIDSGRLAFAKPDPRIFTHTLAALGDPEGTPIHIGDVYSADIVGARGVGWRAIWFGRSARPVDDPDVAVAHDAAGVRAALVRWGAL